MSGTGHQIQSVTASGDPGVDGLLSGLGWAPGTLSYAVPFSAAVYGSTATYAGAGETAGFLALTAQMRATAGFALSTAAGTAADDGFAVGGFTALAVTETTDPTPQLRLAQTTAVIDGHNTAWAYYPATLNSGGDVWFSTTTYNYTAPQAGSYAHHTILHEIGHALGLKHGHESGSYGALPYASDSMEYSVMTYRSYVGATVSNYTNEGWGYAQSYMMLDIAALQHMYGANYTVNSGDTTYAWDPASGETTVNGAVAIAPGANRIFATIWDGGGTDTYDLSAYGSAVTVDLEPGAASLFSDAQQARLGTGQYATGNIYNALLHQDDPRSLIENAIGGAGGDVLRGNDADNALTGNAGNDEIFGRTGNDVLRGGGGADRVVGGRGNDELHGGGGKDRLQGGAGADVIHSGNGRDLLQGGAGADQLEGRGGNDRLWGGGGSDRLTGGPGWDRLLGGDGADLFVFASAADSPAGATPDEIRDFEPGSDRIDLSALGGTAAGLALSQSGGDTLVTLDSDGNGLADLAILVVDVTGLSIGDILL